MYGLRFSDSIETYEVPRLDFDLIDELFYQEDEIGEMRHTAFMIECGLEEDPPDGPDVPPIPWGDKLIHNSSSSSADSVAIQYEPPKKRVPQRTRSSDDIDLLEEELSPESNRRKLVASKSGSLHAMRPARIVKRQPPSRCHSVDDSKAIELSLAFAKTEAGSPLRRVERKLVAAKSGSLHGMRDAVARASAKKKEEGGASDDGDAEAGSNHPRSPVRKLVATKSGTIHGTRKVPRDRTPKTAESNTVRPPRPIAPSRGLGARTKSGTNLTKVKPTRCASPAPTTESHIVYKNGVKTVVTKIVSNSSPDIPPEPTKRRSSRSETSSTGTLSSSSSSRMPQRQSLTKQSPVSGGCSSDAEDDFLTRMVGNSDGDDDSEVSLSTNSSAPDNPISSTETCQKKLSHCPAPRMRTVKAPTSPSHAKKPAYTQTKVRTLSSHTKEKKWVGTTSVKDSSGSDASPSPTNKIAKRVVRREFRSGPPKAERRKSEGVVESAVSSLRNGASTPSQLLQNMQRGDTHPTRSPQTLNRTKSGSSKLRSNSVGNLDIPPAFRGL